MSTITLTIKTVKPVASQPASQPAAAAAASLRNKNRHFLLRFFTKDTTALQTLHVPQWKK